MQLVQSHWGTADGVAPMALMSATSEACTLIPHLVPGPIKKAATSFIISKVCQATLELCYLPTFSTII